MITQLICPTCNKRTDLLSEKPILSSMISRKFKCGHSQIIKKLSNSNGKIFAEPTFCTTHKRQCVTHLLNGEEFSSMRGDHLMPFQAIGVEFGINSADGSVGIFDEMGLGKTVQDLAIVRLKKDVMLPMVIVCKSIAKYNWFKHTLNWVEEIAQFITTTTDKWHEQFPIHIVSYELLRMVSKIDDHSCHVIIDRAQTVTIDETHQMKNDNAERTKAVKKLCKNAKYKIGLSGTPFKNQGMELFTILNTLRPERFHNREQYLNKYWNYYRSGFGYKIGGLRYPEKFKEDTKDFIIRRTMDEVLPDLPKVRRNNIFVELGDEVRKIYDKEYKEMVKFHEDNKGLMNAFEFSSCILERLNKLRHITGIAKVDAGVQFVEEFLESTERKFVLFIHHHKVAFLYKAKIDELLKGMELDSCATLGSADVKNAESIIEEFRTNPKRRVLIASTLAAGESLNLQFASDCLLAERQWNPANEEQAGSGRFRRIGQDKAVNFNYLVAVGTIDEFFTELVEKKRSIFEQVMDGKSGDWNEQGIIKELTEILIANGKAKWSL